MNIGEQSNETDVSSKTYSSSLKANVGTSKKKTILKIKPLSSKSTLEDITDSIILPKSNNINTGVDTTELSETQDNIDPGKISLGNFDETTEDKVKDETINEDVDEGESEDEDEGEGERR